MKFWIGQTTAYSGMFVLLLPCVLFIARWLICNSKAWFIIQMGTFLLCIIGIFSFTLIGRNPGERQYNHTPFWTYTKLHDPQYRWEVYMNIFLFMPFGFLLPFVLKRDFFQTLLLGFALSVCIEAVQFLFCLGFSEFDDVFHNTLGTGLGYGQWKLLSWIETRFGQKIQRVLCEIDKSARAWLKRYWSILKNKWRRGKKK